MSIRYHYKDAVNDDFAASNIKRRKWRKNYPFVSRNPVFRFFGFILYHFVALPLVTLYNKIVYREKIVGRKKLRKYRKTGFFLYGNHTTYEGDAFTPSMLSFPKKAYVIINPDAIFIPVVGHLVRMLGGIPIPEDKTNMRRFLAAVKKRANDGKIIVIYPEAHIWPYYTDIRPFRDVSFRYPVEAGKPIFTFTKTFHKRKLFHGVKTVVYVDGPFFPQENMSPVENRAYLRNCAFNAMNERIKLCTYSKNEYVPIPKESELKPYREKIKPIRSTKKAKAKSVEATAEIDTENPVVDN